jgi:hypothetical protein
MMMMAASVLPVPSHQQQQQSQLQPNIIMNDKMKL